MQQFASWIDHELDDFIPRRLAVEGKEDVLETQYVRDFGFLFRFPTRQEKRI